MEKFNNGPSLKKLNKSSDSKLEAVVYISLYSMIDYLCPILLHFIKNTIEISCMSKIVFENMANQKDYNKEFLSIMSCSGVKCFHQMVFVSLLVL